MSPEFDLSEAFSCVDMHFLIRVCNDHYGLSTSFVNKLYIV